MNNKKAPCATLSHLTSGTLGMLRDYGRAVSVLEQLAASGAVLTPDEKEFGSVEEKERLAFTLGLHIFKMTADEKREMLKGVNT